MRRGLFVAVGSLVAGLREVKDADEIARMRAAALVGCGLFDGMLSLSGAGMTEIAVAATLEYRGAAGWGGGDVV